MRLYRSCRQTGFLVTMAVTAALGHGTAIAQLPNGTADQDSRTIAAGEATAQQVYSLFADRCFRCHGDGADLAGGLDLRSDAGLLAGGDNGRVVVPHDPGGSRLFSAVARTARPFMPMMGTKLSDAELELVRVWIESGGSLAAVPEAAPAAGASPEDLERLENRPFTDEERAYWAFVKPRRHEMPAVGDPVWADNPIDAFLLAAMESRGLTPAAPADRRTLVRRAYLDVLGLPPTPEEIDAFVTDDAPNAWDHLVDRLLASPHYGERWARHWMDLARYADSGGFEFDSDRPYMYRYRDYLVDAFNSDKPYDVFVKEQLAGDEYALGSEEAMVATGFLRVGPEAAIIEADDGPGEIQRLDELDDLITVTSLTFMGVTVGCARCHDHKFDPIAQRDYYRMQAIFHPTVRASYPLAPAPKIEANRAERKRLEQLIAPLLTAKAALEEPFHRVLVTREIVKLPEYLQEAWSTPEDERTEGQRLNAAQMTRSLGVDAFRGIITTDDVVELMPHNVALAHSAVRAEIDRLEASKPKRLPAARVIGEEGRTPEPSYFLHRGSPQAKGSEMAPGVLTVAWNGEWPFAEAPEEADSSWRRLGFAEWLTHPDNPLPARVMVNRLWQHHFGEGIVRTPSNFGKMGIVPTHPELLDWLALEFIERDWSMKSMHRLMLTSRAYRMSSADEPSNVEIDPENLYLWRMPRVRLEAEVIRDAILATAGTLDRTVGGPAIFPFIDPDLFEASSERDWAGLPDTDPSTWRRSLYVFSKRSIRYPMFEAFDQPNLINSIDRRNRTTIAPQVLILMNNPMVAFQATRFAERLRAEVGDHIDALADRAIQIALGRPAEPAELANAVEFIRENPDGLVDFCHLVFNLNEFLYRP